MTFVVSGLHVIYSGKRPLSGLDYITVDTQQPHVSILTTSNNLSLYICCTPHDSVVYDNYDAYHLTLPLNLSH